MSDVDYWGNAAGVSNFSSNVAPNFGKCGKEDDFFMGHFSRPLEQPSVHDNQVLDCYPQPTLPIQHLQNGSK